MYHNTEPDEQDDSDSESRPHGWWNKFKDAFLRDNDDDDQIDEEDEHVMGVERISPPHRSAGGSSTPLKRSTLHLDTVRKSRVTVRHVVQTHQDVQRAVDSLKEGIQQIINFESTPADKAKELTDFMHGAIYAIDGAVERIGDQVYLFTPQSVIVDVEDKPVTTSHTPFFDKS